MRGGEDTIRALPARVASSEVGVTVGEQRRGQSDKGLPSLGAELHCRGSHHQGRQVGGRSEGGSE